VSDRVNNLKPLSVDQSSKVPANDELSFELDESWIYKVSVIADRIARRISQIAARVGDLNLSQWRVLAAIGDQDGRTASQVVELTPMDKGIVSRAVASLVAQGYLKREASNRDGRLSHLYMTASGRKIFEAIVAELDATGAKGDALLDGEDRALFLATLDRLIRDYAAPSEIARATSPR